MSISESDLDSFQQFAKDRIASLPADATLDDLAFQWQISQERNEVNESIRQSLEDMKAGRYRSALVASKEIARNLGIVSE